MEFEIFSEELENADSIDELPHNRKDEKELDERNKVYTKILNNYSKYLEETLNENIFRSDKWKRMSGVDSEVKNEMNRQLRKEVRQLKKDVYVEDDFDYNTSHRVAKRKSNECYRYS